MTTWTTPPTWVAGVTPGNAANLNKLSDDLLVLSETPPTYVPTVVGGGWTSNVSLSGWVVTRNKRVQGWIKATFSGAPAGSGVINLSLPSTPSISIPSFASVGHYTAHDASGSAHTYGQSVYTGGSNLSGWSGSGATRLSNASPYTFASGDFVWLAFEYWID